MCPRQRALDCGGRGCTSPATPASALRPAAGWGPHLRRLPRGPPAVQSSNVLLTAGGTAKLADVGLSRLQQRTYLSDVAAVGTFDFAAPEVLLGGTACTAAVDLYSFGGAGGARGRERGGWRVVRARQGSSVEAARPARRRGMRAFAPVHAEAACLCGAALLAVLMYEIVTGERPLRGGCSPGGGGTAGRRRGMRWAGGRHPTQPSTP